METPANPHLSYDQTKKLYHMIVADISCRWTPYSGRLLDVGCGVGHVLHEIAQRREDLRLDAADPYARCLEITSSRAPINKTYALTENALDLSIIPDNCYDTVILCHVLEHLPRPLEAIAELRRVLRPGGKIVLAVPNSLTPRKFVQAAFRQYSANPGHCFHWDRGHWINFLENIARLAVLEYDHDEVFLFSRSTPVTSGLKVLEKLLGRMFPAWSFSHIAVVDSSKH